MKKEEKRDALVLASILDRLETLHLAVQQAAERCRTTKLDARISADAKRSLQELLNQVSTALEQAYRRRAMDTLPPEEIRFWLPPLESLRNQLRRAIASLPASWDQQLSQAVEQLRQSTVAVSEVRAAP